jgi:hypothetical protein
MLLDALVMLASAAPGEEETSKTAFYVAGGVLAAWAVLLGAVGMARDGWPSESAGKAIMAITAVLVAATMTASALTG